MVNRARLPLAGDLACSRCFVVFSSTLRAYVYLLTIIAGIGSNIFLAYHATITYDSLALDSFDVSLVGPHKICLVVYIRGRRGEYPKQ